MWLDYVNPVPNLNQKKKKNWKFHFWHDSTESSVDSLPSETDKNCFKKIKSPEMILGEHSESLKWF